MKILYLPGYRYPNNLNEPLTSGDLRYSFTLTRSLAQMGHEVTVITRQAKGDPANSVLDGVKILRYTGLLWSIFSTSFDISIRRTRLFRRELKSVDLIICNSPLSLEHLGNIKPPIVYIASGLEDVKNYSLSPKEIAGYIAIKFLREPLKKLTWRRSILVNTTAWGEDSTLASWGVPKEKIGTISSSIDTSRYRPLKEAASSVKHQLKISPEQSLILSVSRFTPAKGIIETIQAFNKLNRPNTHLVIIGVHHSHDSSYYNKVSTEIQNSKQSKNITLLENIPEHELPTYYSAADVTSVFSKGYDPLPTTIIESMSCGTPVVSTYYKTRKQFISDGSTGIFVKEKDLDDWVAKVSNLLDDIDLQTKLSDNGLNYVRKNFDSISIAKKYLEILQK